MRVADRLVRARREKLGRLLERQQYLSIGDVAALLGVSEPTARRDLAALAGAQVITRTHGGALVDYNQRFPSFRERLATSAEGKRRIGAAAVRLLRPGQVLWLDGGTTPFAIAQALAERPVARLTVVTNNMPAADRLAEVDAIEVHVLGGRFLRRSATLLGGKSIDAAAAWTFDVAFLGVEGVAATGAFNSHEDVVTLQRAIMGRARKTIVCADATKVGRAAVARLAPLTDVTNVLSDASADAFRSAGIRLSRNQLIVARPPRAKQEGKATP